ncbi:clathrin adaptor complex small chain family [Cryptosporidium sp. chipmunk genotype I]|uniref:clathrin adaptor complex small chain family n=1 Tax=Cryptosporidium sp. chipmunk genotype I TaxID=1280935 RepID=UPI00351A973B|nr:clathrin adaptor complex small chain family [Cryptosporidium sp. chipmunk genotype I]
MFDSIVGCILMDTDGNRIASRYYGNLESIGLTDYVAQRQFECQLHSKGQKLSGKTEAEALFVGEMLCLVRLVGDFSIYIVSSPSENELILFDVINCIYNSLSIVIPGQLSKKGLFESLDTVHLILDEVTDSSGILFETEAGAVCQRAQMQGSEALENTAFNQAFASAKENIMRGFL